MMLPGLPGGEGLNTTQAVLDRIIRDAIEPRPKPEWPKIIDECYIGWPGVIEFEHNGKRYLMDTNRVFDYDFKIVEEDDLLVYRDQLANRGLYGA